MTTLARTSQSAQNDLHVRVQSSLQEPFHLAAVGGVLCFFLDLTSPVSQPVRETVKEGRTYPDSLLLKQIDDFDVVSNLSLTHSRQLEVRTSGTNDLPLLFGISNTLKTAQEELASLNNCEVNAKVVSERLLDLLALIETHTTSVNEDGMEAVPDGLTHESRANSAVHTAANSAKDESLVTNKIPDASNLELGEVAHFPVRLSSTNVNTEIAEDFDSAGCLDPNIRGSSSTIAWV